MDPPILRHQRKFNRATREAWEGFASHRARVMECILAAAGGRLAVLGAGNVNDIDLARLLESFDELHLVDLDAEAPALGVARQGVAPSSVRVHGAVDLSGVMEHLDGFWGGAADERAAETAVDAAVRAATAFATPSLGGPFDVVVSACLLSQLVDQVVNTLGPDHPGTPRLVRAVRDRHLRLLLDLAAPGGHVLLVTDVLSTAVDPQLGSLPDSALPALLDRAMREGLCFAGTNPIELAAAFAKDPAVAHTSRSAPWRWSVGSLTFLVCAVSADLKRGADPSTRRT